MVCCDVQIKLAVFIDVFVEFPPPAWYALLRGNLLVKWVPTTDLVLA